MPAPQGLEALLAAAHGGAQPPQQAPQEPQPEQGGDSGQREGLQILQRMIQLGQQFIQVEPDAEDKATMAKLLATLHQYLAKEQQDAEAALGGGSATRVLRRLGQ